MTDVYYQLSDGTNSLTFYYKSISPNHSRDVWEQPIPFVVDKWLMDQVTTSGEIAVNFEIKTGTNFPYATFSAAITALLALLTSTRTTGFTLKGGDWNGSSWSYNAAYPEWGAGSAKLVVSNLTYTLNTGENFTNGVITGTVNLKRGAIL